MHLGDTVNRSSSDPTHYAQWMHVEFGMLAQVIASDTSNLPEYQLKVTNWHTDIPLPEMNDFVEGWSPVNYLHPPAAAVAKNRTNTGKWWAPEWTSGIDFTGTKMALPYSKSIHNMLVIDIIEDSPIEEVWVGRIKIMIDALPSTLTAQKISSGGTLQVSSRKLHNDREAGLLMGQPPVGSSNTPLATCVWMDMSVGTRMDVCQDKSAFFTSLTRGDADCVHFIEAITHGSTSMR